MLHGRYLPRVSPMEARRSVRHVNLVSRLSSSRRMDISVAGFNCCSPMIVYGDTNSGARTGVTSLGVKQTYSDKLGSCMR